MKVVLKLSYYGLLTIVVRVSIIVTQKQIITILQDSRKLILHWMEKEKVRTFGVERDAKETPVCLDWAFCSIRAFCIFLVGSIGAIHELVFSTKHRSLSKFGFYSTIHTFKNYFATAFLAISFQFSVFNK